MSRASTFDDVCNALAVVNAFAAGLRGRLEIPEILLWAAQRIAEYFAVEACAIALLNGGSQGTHVVSHPPQASEPAPDPTEWAPPFAAPRFPLVLHGRVIGVLRVGSRHKPPHLAPAEVALAQTLANQLALALERNRLLAESRDEGALYQALFEGVDEGILVMDEQGRYLAANAAACALLGYSQQELLQMRARDLVADSSAPLLRYYRELLSAGGFRAEFDLRHRDGSIVPVELITSAVTVNGERLFVGIHRDLSTLRQTEAQLRQRVAQLEALYLTTVELTAQLTTDEVLQAIVARAAKLLNGTMATLYFYEPREDVLSLKVGYNVGPERLGFKLRPGEGAVGQAWLRDETLNIPNYALFPHRHPAFAASNAAVLVTPLRDRQGVIEVTDAAIGRVFSAQDISLLKLFAHYATIAITQARLFEEAQQTAAALQRANEELRALDRLKDDFLAMVTHELRQPLANARLGIEHLLSQRAGELGAPQRGVLSMVLKSIEEQSTLVDNLLTLLRLQKREQTFPVPLDLGRVIQDALISAEGLLQEKGLTLFTAFPGQAVPFHGDPLHLEKLVTNLLSNAIKFTPPGGEIRVTLEVQDGQAVLSVQDSGVGIPAEYQQQIFERFTQGDGGYTRNYPGLGLGLALVKEIVEEYRGKIEVVSAQDQGSVFRVRLPLAPPSDSVHLEHLP
jgi:PAS domain S-box-containing protein